MQQYFISGLPDGAQVTISDKDTAKHMFSVMRLQADDEVVLVFDDGVKRRASLRDRDSQTFDLLEDLESNVELPVEVVIASGFPKGDKLEFLAQKATELGVSQLWAYPADWSVVKWDGKKLAKKVDKLGKIARDAAQQSKRNRIPAVKLFDKPADFLAQLEAFDQIFIAYEESAKEGEQSALAQALAQVQPGQKLLFIFGPEGGISPAEVAKFEAAGGQRVGLGPRIMRTETAPLYALASVSFALELAQRDNHGNH